MPHPTMSKREIDLVSQRDDALRSLAEAQARATDAETKLELVKLGKLKPQWHEHPQAREVCDERDTLRIQMGLLAREVADERARVRQLEEALRLAGVLDAVSDLLASEPGTMNRRNGLQACSCPQFRGEKSCIHSTVSRAARAVLAASAHPPLEIRNAEPTREARTEAALALSKDMHRIQWRRADAAESALADAQKRIEELEAAVRVGRKDWRASTPSPHEARAGEPTREEWLLACLFYFGNHHPTCAAGGSATHRHFRCDCGFSAVLEQRPMPDRARKYVEVHGLGLAREVLRATTPKKGDR